MLKEEIATAQKNIKAKNKGKNVKFVIDKEGKLITVDPVRPEGLPPFAVPLGTNIAPEGVDENDGKRRGKGRKSIRVPGAVSVPLEDLYFKAANTLATTLAGGEQIKEIQPGVSIQAGENVRMGPESLALPNKQTRKEYLRGSSNQMGSYVDGLGSSLDSPGIIILLYFPSLLLKRGLLVTYDRTFLCSYFLKHILEVYEFYLNTPFTSNPPL